MLTVFCLALMLPVKVYAEIELNLKTDSATNTYVNGKKPEIVVEYANTAAGKVSYHWEDYTGARLSSPAVLAEGGSTTIDVPDQPPGYLTLVFTPNSAAITLATRQPGEPREYGFVIFPGAPAVAKAIDADIWMGLVHADPTDPWLSGGLKSMTWKTTSAKWWLHEMDKRRDAGFIELPIITGSEWKSADNSKIDADQLERLRQRVSDYMSADPATIYWETGIEENLGGRFSTPFYFENLALKSTVVRSVADEVNPEIKLLFQIANMRSQDVGIFLDSEASVNYDIIALHPYNWPDFPAPETWLEGFLQGVQQQIAAHDRDMPLWITEVGAPHAGNSPGAFFGYPKKQKTVRGLSRQEMVSYLIKFHVISYDQGVANIFWYNYRDRGPSRDYAEDHFGLIDYWGYPKPVYPAYVTMLHNLADKSVAKTVSADGVWAYRFSGDTEDIVVAWSYPAAELTASFKKLGICDPAAQVTVSNALGDVLKMPGTEVHLSSEPVYIHLNNN